MLSIIVDLFILALGVYFLAGVWGTSAAIGIGMLAIYIRGNR